ncbi:MAG TPA: nucleotidyltransferase family protein [Gemmatimonadaceae bacterium]|nr:nucleotidyltransferase family protein [Gemmatimonadaceae bacterium]
MPTHKLVILARGLGTRMRKVDETAKLDEQQATAASAGVKAMIPIGSRPFVDYLLTSVADAGFTNVCLVIGPEHEQLRARYEREIVPTRLKIDFAIQERALGTANAVLSAENFAGGDTFAVINSDNFYPADALTALNGLSEPAIVGFDRDILVREGNVSTERTQRFGALDVDDGGYLRRILVSPTEEMLSSGGPIYSSMNCFLFDREIFRACRDVPVSARGEFELPQAMHYAMDRGWIRFKVVKIAAPVLDMSSRGDIAGIVERLRAREMNF